MRVSTAMMFESSVQAMMRREAELLRTQQQIAGGKRLLTPGEDPVASAQAVDLRARQAVAAQSAANIAAAGSLLSAAEAKLGEAGEVLQAVRELLVAAGNGTYSDADRRALATELRARRSELLGIANATDGQGRYLFAGYQDAQRPFSDSAAGVAYLGDQGGRALAISPSRELPVSASGEAVFCAGRSGNGVFAIAGAGGNMGSGAADIGAVYDASLLTGNAYRIVFAAGGSTYDVLDLTAGTTVVSGAAFASGQAMRFDGIELAVHGTPLAGDRYDIAPSARQSVFAALDSALAALEAPQPGAAERAGFATRLGRSLAELDSSMNAILEARAAFGAALRETESAAAATEADAVRLAGALSAAEDVDVAKAASDLARQKLALEAAQQAHVLTARLSLFDYF